MEMPKQKKILMPRGAIQKKAEWSGTRGSYLTHIPNLSRDTLEEIEVVPIREPFTYSRIVYDHDRSEYVYEVWEPQLNAEEKEFLDMIKDSLNRTLEYEWDKMAEKDKKEYLQEAVDSFIVSKRRTARKSQPEARRSRSGGTRRSPSPRSNSSSLGPRAPRWSRISGSRWRAASR